MDSPEDDPEPFDEVITSGNAGPTALLPGDVDAARYALCEELELCRETVVLPIVTDGLSGLATVAAVRGDLDRAARLAGYALADTR
jgi:hypothetical protein